MSGKLRILVITQYFFPEQGAVAPQHRVKAFARHMVEQGNEVTVLCEFPNYPTGIIPPEYHGKWFDRDTMDGFDILRVWVKASPNKGFKARMLSYVSFMFMAVFGAALKLPGRFDVVMATSPPLTVCVSGWLIAVLKRAKLVLEIRDLWPQVAVAASSTRSPVAFAFEVELINQSPYRIRGSARPYAMSVSRFSATTTRLAKDAMACTRAKSRLPMASASRFPRPGQEKIVSI